MTEVRVERLNFSLYICILIKIAGISSKTIVNFFAEKTSDEIKKNLSVFFRLTAS